MQAVRTSLALLALAGSAGAQQLSLLYASDSQTRTHFGECVAAVPGTIVAGSSRHTISGQVRGSAYVYVGDGSSWTQQAELLASDGQPKDFFGCSVGISGSTVVVGAFGDDHVDGSNADEGSAYVFVRTGSSWSQQAKLAASDAAGADFFGQQVAVSGDTIAVAAPNADALDADSGAVYVFVRSGTTWTQQAKITPGDGTANDAFGHSLALEGDTLVVGADQHTGGAPNSGVAYVFVRSGTTWSQQGELGASDAAANDAFGKSVSLSGGLVVVGASQRSDAGAASGAAYLFARGAGAWSQQAKLSAGDAKPLANFGQSVSISRGVVLVGASGDHGIGTASGSAYVFLRNDTGWVQTQKIGVTAPAKGDFFGASVAAVGLTFVLGIPARDDTNVDSGAVAVYAGEIPGWYAHSGKTLPPVPKPLH